MSAELQTRSNPDVHVYAVIRNSVAHVWNGTSFVTFMDADYADYVVPLTEQGTSSGYYVGDFPAVVMSAGEYVVEFFQRAGSDPAIADDFIAGGVLSWDGSAAAGPTSLTMLTSLTYVKVFGNITGSTYDTFLTNRISAVSMAVERYCRRTFALQDHTDFYDGADSYELLLHQYPVTAIDTVTLHPYSSAPEAIDGSTYIISKEGIIRLKPTGSATAFFCRGFNNIKVEYSAGYGTIPEDVQDVVAQAVVNQYRKREADLTMTGEVIGDYQYTRRSDAGVVLTADMKTILNAYRAQVA